MARKVPGAVVGGIMASSHSTSAGGAFWVQTVWNGAEHCRRYFFDGSAEIILDMLHNEALASERDGDRGGFGARPSTAMKRSSALDTVLVVTDVLCSRDG